MTTISQTMLSCGMPLIVESNPGVRSAALAWMLPAGWAHEPSGLLGLSAMWSELLLRGAGNLDSRGQADAFDLLGAGRSAAGSTFHFQLGATVVGKDLRGLLPLLADMVRRPRMDEGSIEPARELALQAIESLADEPAQRAAIALRLRHRPDPVNRSGLGEPGTLRAMTRDDLRREWARLAAPRGAVLAIAGAATLDEAQRDLEPLLAGWSGAEAGLAFEAEGERGYGHINDPSNQVHIYVAHDAPAETHEDAWLERIVVSVLSGGMSGRLFTEVREKRGLCYSVSAAYKAGKEFGAVTAYVGTTPERAQQSLDVLADELRRINRSGIEREEFERAVVGMKSRLVFSGESTGARAASLAGDWLRLGRTRSLAELGAKVDAITLEAVNAYLERRRLGRISVQSLGPTPLDPARALAE
ncbi:MAG: insulinase family protein [Phycisphaerales bacterium]|nr:insulinase family protein [Phycisphaerales bacterium]